MNIILNGEPREVAQDLTVKQLIDELGLAEGRLAVEVNLEIVPRSLHADTRLKANDKIEVVHAIGGG